VMTHLGLARWAEDQGQTRVALRSAARGLSVARREKLRYETAPARYEIGRIKQPVRPPSALLGTVGIKPGTLRRWQDIP